MKGVIYTVYCDEDGSICVLNEREPTNDDIKAVKLAKLNNVFSDVKGGRSLFDVSHKETRDKNEEPKVKIKCKSTIFPNTKRIHWEKTNKRQRADIMSYCRKCQVVKCQSTNFPYDCKVAPADYVYAVNLRY